MRWNNKVVWVAVAAIVAGVALLGTAYFSDSSPSSSPASSSTPSSSAGSTASPASTSAGAPGGSAPPAAPAKCAGGWDCAQQARFTAASAIVAKTAGHIGIVVRDRTTGAVWQSGEPTYKIWAGSTPKLAFAVALKEEARAGEITLDATASSQIDAMLHVSDNKAADTLWNRYANATALMTRWRTQYGMTTATYVSGFPSRWGFVKCTAQDLANLVSYILTKLNTADRGYIVSAMRSVGSIQHWGVWGAGAAQQPGVKDGWSIEKDDGQDHWITATAGFAGPNERYIVAAMYHQFPGGDSIDKGVHTLTDLIATVFGAPVPAPVTIPQDY